MGTQSTSTLAEVSHRPRVFPRNIRSGRINTQRSSNCPVSLPLGSPPIRSCKLINLRCGCKATNSRSERKRERKYRVPCAQSILTIKYNL